MRFKLNKQTGSREAIVRALKGVLNITTGEAIKMYSDFDLEEEQTNFHLYAAVAPYYNCIEFSGSNDETMSFEGQHLDKDIKEAEEWCLSLSDKEQRFIQIIKDNTKNFIAPIG